MAIAFICLLAALTLASPASLDHQAAWLQKIELVFGITLCVSILLADPTHRRQLQMVLTITGALLSLYAIWQRVVLFPALTDFPWSELVTTGPWRNIPVHTAEFAATVIARRRVFGPFPLPGLLASALVMLLPISVDTLRGWATTPARRLFTSVVWGLQGTALLLTQSLRGWLE